MPTYLTPGTFVEETSYRPKLIKGAATSRAAFTGVADGGPVGTASPSLSSFAEFEALYGSEGDLAAASRGFFENGGRYLNVVRVAVTEGEAEPDLASFTQALALIAAMDDISIIAAPGSSALSIAKPVAQALIDQAEAPDAFRFAVLDAPPAASVAEVRAYRAQFNSPYAALYYPWLTVIDPATGGLLAVPPSGSVCGIFARVDAERGVWKAPANEIIRGIVGFEKALGRSEQEVLNPEGINCLRSIDGRGLRLWGARTISSDPDWKYVSIRRYVTYLEQSLSAGLLWTVFERHAEPLWAHFHEAVGNFLYQEWRNGALIGQRPEDAFFVRCDRSTMTQDDISEGRLISQIGVALLRPAEFIIFRILASTADTNE